MEGSGLKVGFVCLIICSELGKCRHVGLQTVCRFFRCAVWVWGVRLAGALCLSAVFGAVVVFFYVAALCEELAFSLSCRFEARTR